MKFAVMLLLLAGCCERAAAEEPLAVGDWLAQITDMDTDAPQLIERVPPTFPSLDALAKDELWDCVPSEPGCLRTFWSGTFEGSALREVSIVGERAGQLEQVCTWRLVVHADVGWLPSRYLGSSSRGCETRMDVGSLGIWRYWYPLAVTREGNAIRIEAQGQSSWELWSSDLDQKVERRVDHVVDLCRIEANAIACGREAAPGRVLARFSDPLPKAFTEALPLAPTLLPFSALADVGPRVPVTFLGVPARPGQPAHIGVLRDSSALARMVEWPLGGGRLVAFYAAADRMTWEADVALIYYQRGDQAWSMGGYSSDYLNATLAFTPHAPEHGVARMSFERVNSGTMTVTWRWDQLYVATDKGVRGFLIPTGVTLADRQGVVGGWWIDVQPSATGVRLVEADGPLAWFRDTGRWSWTELEAAIPRWQERIVKATFQAHERVEWPKVARHPEDEKEPVAPLALVPGYVEPIYKTLVPQVLTMP